jgi:pyruvate,water dikinase
VADVHEKGHIEINLLQCRPLSEVRDQENVILPEYVDPKDILFQTDSCVNTALVDNLRYIVYVDSDGYHDLPMDEKYQVGRAIGRINGILEAARKSYILIGPGRWGSNNIDLGVNVSYADIDASSVIVEVAKSSDGYVPEVSYGTHFFQDLVEDRIYYLAVYPGLPDNILNEDYLRTAPNAFEKMATQYKKLSQIVRVIKMDKDKEGFRLVMDRQKNRAICFCVYS